ncbi:cupin-like domain-containing protein [Paraburkholderia sp.]|uniref:cupin-like domain-containing protein n=1 Tax=Paraburkholderia sp. TaxID=1926495 RepID=UPI00239C8AFA|nr:cupin-like domain-containing protein [Paraburkholderia sp.]MDE1181470.1 cupin-like domain-containing protein [Paraburkholderia sp.]
MNTASNVSREAATSESVAPAIDDAWRRWIAENLLLDASPDALHAVLVQHGFAAHDASREVDAALASPYFQGGARLRNRVRKRDWALSVYSALGRMRDGTTGTDGNVVIERRDRLPRDVFFNEYYCQNRPVVITGAFDAWPARTQWNFDYFRARCGDCEVEVQFGRDADANYEVNQPQLKRTMRFGDYIDLIESSGPTNDFYMTANNTSKNRASLAALWADAPPIVEYLDGESLDSGFFWFGPAGTKTPLHHDLTNNFMAQVIGRKRVTLIPMSDTPHVYNHLHCYSQVDASAVDNAQFPAMQQAQRIECTLEPGELLFLPVGWWHYVEGLDASVTMTFINFLKPNDFTRTYSTYHEL